MNRTKAILCALTVTALVGCANEEASSKKKDTHRHEKTAIVKEKEPEVKASLLEEPPATVKSPAEAILHQYSVIYTNGHKKKVQKKDLISEATFGNKGIVTLHSLEFKDSYKIAYYDLMQPSKRWALHSTFTNRIGPEESLNPQKHGLKLPMTRVNISHMKINKAMHMWNIADQQFTVSILTFTNSKQASSPAKTVVLPQKKSKAYLSIDAFTHPVLYYFDGSKTVLLSGNLNEQQIITVADSLPTIATHTFPLPH
ncbi:hypothetical protein A374_16078 [Fictibacillus macauensis ZFHKF-1]|uniref:Lipoprotein n=1 Tax=Fictibacillus macauensis ZFHKF-1 TaxID=1196324 RepID=I8UBK5_9BACL|nr:hypothetical protein [Fictibacillus macauensis]EIT84320.1 hypothetical protein A374_16078 [Fictibacillus macauensis ZFHKF-1]